MYVSQQWGNILDLFFASVDTNICDVTTWDISYSDQILIRVSGYTLSNLISMFQPNLNHSNEPNDGIKTLHFYNKDIDWSLINNQFLEIDWDASFL